MPKRVISGQDDPLRKFKCEKCGRAFKRRFTLQEHLKIHTGERPHKCDFAGCDSRFSTSGNLSRHKKVHYAGMHRCNHAECGKLFMTSNLLSKHRAVHKKLQVKKCPTPDCNRSFATAVSLQRHMKRHCNFSLTSTKDELVLYGVPKLVPHKTATPKKSTHEEVWRKDATNKKRNGNLSISIQDLDSLHSTNHTQSLEDETVKLVDKKQDHEIIGRSLFPQFPSLPAVPKVESASYRRASHLDQRMEYPVRKKSRAGLGEYGFEKGADNEFAALYHAEQKATYGDCMPFSPSAFHSFLFRGDHYFNANIDQLLYSPKPLESGNSSSAPPIRHFSLPGNFTLPSLYNKKAPSDQGHEEVHSDHQESTLKKVLRPSKVELLVDSFLNFDNLIDSTSNNIYNSTPPTA